MGFNRIGGYVPISSTEHHIGKKNRMHLNIRLFSYQIKKGNSDHLQSIKSKIPDTIRYDTLPVLKCPGIIAYNSYFLEVGIPHGILRCFKAVSGSMVNLAWI